MKAVVLGAGITAGGFAFLGLNLLASLPARRSGREFHWAVGWLLNGIGMLGIGAGWVFLSALPPRLDFLPLTWVGAVSAFFGTWLYVASATRVGRLRSPSNYSLGLESSGAYARVRHPQALAFILLGIGLGGLSRSVPFLATLPLWIASWWAYTRLEERLELIPAFGERYLEYARKTPLLIPSLFRPLSSEPKEAGPRRSGC